jgi:hypothetical protein
VKGFDATKWLITCYSTVLFLSIFFDFSSTKFEISLFLCSSIRSLTLVVLDSSIIVDELPQKMVISFSELNRCTEKPSFSFELIWLSAQFSSVTLTLRYFAWSSLPWFRCALRSTFGLLRKFLHSVTPAHFTCCYPKHNSRRRSLLMLVLSHSDTH